MNEPSNSSIFRNNKIQIYYQKIIQYLEKNQNKLLVLIKLNFIAFINGYILKFVFNNFILFTIGIILMHFIVYNIVFYSISGKKLLPEMKNQYKIQSRDLIYIILWAIIEGISYQFVNLKKCDNLFYNLLTFLPVTFLFEIIYDFIFYIHHYLAHKNKILYKFLHKKHHQHHNNINLITLYYTDTLDIIINSIYIIFITYLIPIYELQFFTWIFHKILVELAGHSATDDNHSCFSQFIYIPRILDIDLNKADHFLHHISHKYNYSKRFSLWDKVFGTYKQYKLENNNNNQMVNQDQKLSLNTRLLIGFSLLIIGYLS